MEKEKTGLCYSLIAHVPVSIPCPCFQACPWVCVRICLLLLSFLHVCAHSRLSACRSICSRSGSLGTHPPSVNSGESSPDFTQNSPAADLFHSSIRPRYHSHCLLNSVPLSIVTHTLMKTYLYTSCSSVTQGQSLSRLHTLVCNITWIDTREKQ